MTVEQTEFTFPDEQVDENPRKGGAVVEPETDIEIVDDTPEADRGRKPMSEPPKDVTDDELAKYDESVQRRIKHFTKGYHDERRAKEAAERAREEALAIAQKVAEENRQLKGTLSEGQTLYIEQSKKVAASEVEQARAKYKAAYEAGDSDALVAAQMELTTATMKAERISNFKPTPLQEEKTEVQPPQQEQPTPSVDPKLRAWQSQNPWWGTNKKMTAYALGLHSELVDTGISVGGDDYYQAIDAEMRTRFPDAFESEKPADAPTPQRRSNVVAPATRSTAPRKVVLTKTQVEIAKRLGVPLELYARKVAEEMRK
jgi:hypothetical protein